jgi:ABC-2 type transport system ATP-binding protein
MPAIKVENLTKKFGEFTAVDSISFEIKEGEVFGLLGPNGAGKTTTISMLATILKPSEGKAIVNNFDVLKEEDNVRKSIGIVFQDQSLDDELTAYENMDFHGRLYHVPKKLREERIQELLKLVELYERKNSLVKTFSGGMRRRLEIARGLLHEPKILFLDEPTLGLDPQTRNNLWEYIEKLNKEKGITLILTTHYMDEADRLCDRIAIIDKGKIVALDSPEKLKQKIGGEIIEIKSKDFEKLNSKINASWVKKIEKQGNGLKINVENAENHIAEIVNLAGKNNLEIEAISINKPSLEDVFLHFTGKKIREENAAGNKDLMRMHSRVWGRR